MSRCCAILRRSSRSSGRPEADDPEYLALQAAFSASVAAMDTAVHAGDVAAIKAAKAKLKPAYAKFFLKFG